MIRPVVGIACQFDPSPSNRNPDEMRGTHRLSEDYIRAVRLSDGLPVLLPTTPDPEVTLSYLRFIDGLILSGGGDLDPYSFGEEPIPALRTVDPLRDAFETILCREALALEIPILAICKGAQILNIVAGGTMVQDIATAIDEPLQHAQHAPMWYGSHRIEVEPDSLLAELLGTTTLRVNSFHHQANAEVGAGFRATAHTSDGVIEAIESVEHPFAIGVQFHPEGMFDVSPEIAGLFRGLVEACRSARERFFDDGEALDQPL